MINANLSEKRIWHGEEIAEPVEIECDDPVLPVCIGDFIGGDPLKPWIYKTERITPDEARRIFIELGQPLPNKLI